LLEDFPEWRDAGSGIDDLIDSILVDDMSAKSAGEIVKRLRQQASVHFKSMDDPAKRALAFAEKKAANAIDALIGRNLDNMGLGGLHAEWHTARETIAKSYTVERALTEGSGNVASHKLARMYSKGDPITGELKDAAKYAQTFDRATQEIKSSMPGISPLDAGVTAIGGAAGGPSGLATAMGMVAGRPAARNLITSAPWQKSMTTPQYPNYVQLINSMKKLPTATGVLAPSAYLSQQ